MNKLATLSIPFCLIIGGCSAFLRVPGVSMYGTTTAAPVALAAPARGLSIDSSASRNGGSVGMTMNGADGSSVSMGTGVNGNQAGMGMAVRGRDGSGVSLGTNVGPGQAGLGMAVDGRSGEHVSIGTSVTNR